MSSRQIATSTLWQIASQITMAALSIASVKFVAIGLTKELAGSYNSAYGFLQLFGILADFGLYAIAVRELSKAKDRSLVFGSLLAIRLGILCISLGAAIMIAWSIPSWQDTPLPVGITIAALVPFFTLIAGVMRAIFQVQFVMHYVFIAEVLQRIITTTAIGMWILTGTRNSSSVTTYYWFLLIGGLGAGMLCIVSYWYARAYIPIRINVDLARMKRMFIRAAPYGIAFFCMALYRQFDITMIALLHPNFEVENAYYGFVLRMVEMGYIIPTFLLNSTLPVLSKRFEEGVSTANLLGKTLFILCILGSISLLYSLIWARPLIQLLTTSSYLSTPTQAGSDTALQLMSIPIFLNGFIVYAFYTLLTIGRSKELVRYLLLGACISVITNYFLIPSYGFVGASITSIIVHIFIATSLMRYALRLQTPSIAPIWYRQWTYFTVLLAIALLSIRPFLQHEFHTIIALIGSVIIMLGAFKVSGIYRSLRTFSS